MLLLLVQTRLRTFAKGRRGAAAGADDVQRHDRQPADTCLRIADSSTARARRSQCYGVRAGREPVGLVLHHFESSTRVLCKLQAAQPLNLQPRRPATTPTGRCSTGANCVVPRRRDARGQCYVLGFELRWSSVMDLYNLVGHDTFTSRLTDVNTVEEAMSKFVAPAKNEMKRQCEGQGARSPYHPSTRSIPPSTHPPASASVHASGEEHERVPDAGAAAGVPGGARCGRTSDHSASSPGQITPRMSEDHERGDRENGPESDYPKGCRGAADAHSQPALQHAPGTAEENSSRSTAALQIAARERCTAAGGTWTNDACVTLVHQPLTPRRRSVRGASVRRRVSKRSYHSPRAAQYHSVKWPMRDAATAQSTVSSPPAPVTMGGAVRGDGLLRPAGEALHPP